ncbi:MAG: hypothetical protein R2912_10065 [Eubacteriales bacterium]
MKPWYMTEAEIDSISSLTGKSLATETKVMITIQPEARRDALGSAASTGTFSRIRTGEPKLRCRRVSQC